METTGLSWVITAMKKGFLLTNQAVAECGFAERVLSEQSLVRILFEY